MKFELKDIQYLKGKNDTPNSVVFVRVATDAHPFVEFQKPPLLTFIKVYYNVKSIIIIIIIVKKLKFLPKNILQLGMPFR